MWKSQLGVSNNTQSKDSDDWDTDPDYVNNVSEKEQRWGAKHIAGSGHHESVDLKQLREGVRSDDTQQRKKILEEQNPGFGYGGKYGIEKDRMDKTAVGTDYQAPKEKHTSQIDYQKGFGGKYGKDERVDKSAVGWDYKAEVPKHQSQKDYKGGFGGEFGIQTDRQDKSAVGWEYRADAKKHESQTDYKSGFGGQFGIQKNAQDKNAVGWDHHEKPEKHSSQKDYATGFGGKHGVQNTVDKSAVGWDYHAEKEDHGSQKDYKTGFGGKFGVQTDRQDQSAHGWDEKEKSVSAPKKVQIENGSGKAASSLKAKFESMALDNAQEAQKKTEEERVRRKALDDKERDQASQAEEQRQKLIAEEHKRLEEEEERTEKREVESDHEMEKEVKPARQAFRYDAPASASVRKEIIFTEKPAEPETEDKREVKLSQQAFRYDMPVAAASQKEIVEEMVTSRGDSDQEKEPLHDEPQDTVAGRGAKAIAMFDYQAVDEDELSFDPEDLITNIDFVDDGWWRGECKGKVGLFPSNYVELQH